MPQNPQITQTPPLKIRRLTTEKLFFLLAHPLRRRILRGLARGEMKTAMNALPASGQRRHTCLKQFSLLCKVGLLIQKENPNDGRRPLYGLAPGVVVQETSDAITLDFGGGGIRCFKDERYREQ